MPNSVLIILVAVVVLIAVVVYLGMRYLRSDEEEEFNTVATERGHGRSGHVQTAQNRARRAHDDLDGARDLPRQAARTGRDASGRREADARREARPGRPGYYDDDRTELVPVGGRSTHPGRGSAGGGTGAGRPSAPNREFGRESRDFDREGASRRDARATRTSPGVRELAVADLDALDRRSTARSAGRPDSTKNGRAGRDQQETELPQVKPRPGSKNGSKSKSKRDSDGDWSDGDWPSNEWDELSDVDYWTELAADKPFTADAPSTGSGRASAGRSDRTDKRRQEPARPQPARSASARPEPARTAPARSQPVRPEPARSVPARFEPSRFEPAPAEPLRAASNPRHAQPQDDDPLTSPSFPRVAANDSRSYRRSRSGSHERPAQDYAAAPTSYDQPEYQAPAASYGHNGSLPASYQTPAASSNGYPPAGGYEPSQPGQPASPASGYSYGSDPLGYSGYDWQGATNGYPAYQGSASPAGYGSDGFGGYAAGPASTPPGSHHQPGAQAYPYQPGVPESYQAPAGATAPYQYQPPSGRPGHNGDAGGYAGADPYAADPYGYSGYGNGSY